MSPLHTQYYCTNQFIAQSYLVSRGPLEDNRCMTCLKFQLGTDFVKIFPWASMNDKR